MFFPKLCGVFAVLKPPGITSAALCNKIREDVLREAGVEDFGDVKKLLKIGHGGTLDQDARGVFIIGINDGCKALTNLLHSNKKYVAIGRLGIETVTYNDTGKVVQEMPYAHVSRESLVSRLPQFQGEILQVPPKYSALKYKGRRLSDLCFAGEALPDIKARSVVVHALSCSQYDPPYFTLDVHCGGGFYVRSLIHDLGKAVGSCAHMVDLVRTQHGPFAITDAIPENQWTLDNIIKAIEHGQRHYGDEVYHRVERRKR